MNFFVTGVGGQLGHDVMNELLKRGHEGVGSDIQETYSGVADGSAVTKAPYVALDITDKEAVEKVITEVNPDAVIHCAAWTAVDMAEDDDKVAKVRAINAGGTQNIADVCKKLDCKMTYISTDYVFDGQGTEPWQPDCKDYKPLNVYGQTKLEGELAVSQTLEKYFIVRIAWVFGLNGKNFISADRAASYAYLIMMGSRRDGRNLPQVGQHLVDQSMDALHKIVGLDLAALHPQQVIFPLGCHAGRFQVVRDIADCGHTVLRGNHALRSLKAKKQEQPAQEQDKPKKAKKKGMEL